MNYASDFFTAAVKPFVRRSSSKDQSCSERLDPVRLQQPSDIEEDGFLVVGQTKSDRSTIVASEFLGTLDAPPQYSSVQDSNKELPTYTNVMQSTQSNQGWMNSNHLNPVNQHVPMETVPGSYGTLVTANSAVTGVQFTFSPRVQVVIDATRGSNNIPSVNPHIFDGSRYDYDFSLENQVINSL